MNRNELIKEQAQVRKYIDKQQALRYETISDYNRLLPMIDVQRNKLYNLQMVLTFDLMSTQLMHNTTQSIKEITHELEMKMKRIKKLETIIFNKENEYRELARKIITVCEQEILELEKQEK